jgi:hypothetical protein
VQALAVDAQMLGLPQGACLQFDLGFVAPERSAAESMALDSGPMTLRSGRPESQVPEQPPHELWLVRRLPAELGSSFDQIRAKWRISRGSGQASGSAHPNLDVDSALL